MATIAPERKKIANAYQAEKQKFHVFRSAFLAIEGIGAQGAYDLRGSVTVRGRQLIVSAMGFTPALQVHTHKDNIIFHANATLMRGDKRIARKQLTRKPSEA